MFYVSTGSGTTAFVFLGNFFTTLEKSVLLFQCMFDQMNSFCACITDASRLFNLNMLLGNPLFTCKQSFVYMYVMYVHVKLVYMFSIKSENKNKKQ